MLPNRDILITVFHLFGVYSISNLNYYPDTVPHYFQSNRDEIRSANLALISGRQMHRINACIFLVAITKRALQFYSVAPLLCCEYSTVVLECQPYFYNLFHFFFLSDFLSSTVRLSYKGFCTFCLDFVVYHNSRTSRSYNTPSHITRFSL